MKPDVIIIGAGASGLMCAITAARRGRRILILDHNAKPGAKVMVSGGGRCNFTNRSVSADNYVSANRHFVKSALSRFGPQDFIKLLDMHRVHYREEDSGKIFSATSSHQIIGALLNECKSLGVKICTGAKVNDVSKDVSFGIKTSAGIFESASLVIATGGLSYPKLGASDLGHRIARKFGLSVTKCRPGLVPLVFKPTDLARFKDLSGISFGAKATCGKVSVDGGILFTHRGLSGPAILETSIRWQPGEEITIDMLPEIDIHEKLISLKKNGSRLELKTILAHHLPRRLAEKWCTIYAPSKPVSSYICNDIKKIAHKLKNWEVYPAGTSGYTKAEVTLGGVDTRGISSKTMESNNVRGLYFIGEVLDVAGSLGGFNLQWAWSSGHAAGEWA